MNNSWSLSEVTECVKKVVDGVRCIVCDKTGGARVRYLCGHTTCDGCLTVADGCMLCLTPSTHPAVVDEPFSQRAQNACSLLNICQDTFNVDVYRSVRASEQLRVEKDLFPKCIQAPIKYFNKRKSIASNFFKENRSPAQRYSFYPGEIVAQSNSFKMNKSNNYVQQWLNTTENHSRKALADLTVNYQTNKKGIFGLKSTAKRKDLKNKDVPNIGNRTKRKGHSNSSYSLLDTSKLSDLKLKKTRTNFYDVFEDDLNKDNQKQNVNDESGIVLDDEPILIEDSQSEIIDKDVQALLAVQMADNEQCSTTDSSENMRIQENLLPPVRNDSGYGNQIKHSQNVPFYKRGPILHNCYNLKKNDSVEINNDTNNISVTIENNKYVTTINISNLTEVDPTYSSIHVQTDISDIPKKENNVTVKTTLVSEEKTVEQNQKLLGLDSLIYEGQQVSRQSGTKKRVLESKNMFDDNDNDDLSQKRKCIVIDDSDVSSSSEASILCVTAEVHRSCEQLDYEILGEIDTGRLPERPRKKIRGATPDSNNSSDKENCDPNKNRKYKNFKKGKFPKKLCTK